MAQTVTTTQLAPGDKLLIDNYSGKPLTVVSVRELAPGKFNISLTSTNEGGRTFQHQLEWYPADHEFERE